MGRRAAGAARAARAEEEARASPAREARRQRQPEPTTGGGGRSRRAVPSGARPRRRRASTRGRAAKPAAATDAGFHIQVLATSDRDKAEALVARLVDADFKAFIAPSNEGGRTMYRVRVGPFSDRAIAAGKAQELKSRWGLDSWISPGAP